LSANFKDSGTAKEEPADLRPEILTLRVYFLQCQLMRIGAYPLAGEIPYITALFICECCHR
jgi:hypothetical protein